MAGAQLGAALTRVGALDHGPVRQAHMTTTGRGPFATEPARVQGLMAGQDGV